MKAAPGSRLVSLSNKEELPPQLIQTQSLRCSSRHGLSSVVVESTGLPDLLILNATVTPFAQH